ncbi:hypothetical protein R3W88_001142 [Solanum pinnatisectum]|uniref:RNase H type-1 domain-containing protein n=1 Tax=Solanum pinnatisectum TaxID=50273 RepID=A0AAV9MKA0_9SOLN|nr:hypothetical protein R3W88_001142 [Solanum pinnatisectum]
MDLHSNQLCQVVENLRPSISHKIVVWNRQQQGMIKLNTDGSFLEHNRKAGIRGMARDITGEFIFVFAIPIWCKDHNVDEATTAKYVFQWFKNNRPQEGIIEMDSLLVVDMINNRTSQNCNLKFIVDETADLVENVDF